MCVGTTKRMQIHLKIQSGWNRNATHLGSKRVSYDARSVVIFYKDN
jgi:hypothetical protein